MHKERRIGVRAVIMIAVALFILVIAPAQTPNHPKPFEMPPRLIDVLGASETTAAATLENTKTAYDASLQEMLSANPDFGPPPAIAAAWSPKIE